MALTPSQFVQLRTLLDQTERDMVTMRTQTALAAQTVAAVDQAEAMLAGLRLQGVDVRAEEGRADSLRGRLLREAQVVHRLVMQGGGAARLAGSMLWQAIRTTEEARRKRVRRNVLLTISGIALAALLVFVVLPRLFPLPPTANTVAVAQLAAEGDLAGALARAQAEQMRAPTDQQIGLWIAAIEQQLGQQAQADTDWTAAQARYTSETDFFSEKTFVLLALGDLERAEQSATKLQQIPGGEAVGLFHLGSVREGQGRYSEAILLFQQAAALADQQNKPELAVAARTRQAALLQSPR